MDYLELGYIGLFIISFLAATLLPLTSEGVLLLFLAASFDSTFCLIIATTGNVLGGLTNYFIGTILHPDKIKTKFRNPKQFSSISNKIQQHGYWLGAFSWLPIVGDPMTVLLGFFRVQFIPFLVLMILGKFLRYWLIIFVWNQ